MGTVTISRQQMVDFIQQFREVQEKVRQERPDGFMTTKELCKAMGYSEKKMRTILGELDEEGMIERAPIYMHNLAKVLIPKTGYRVKTE
jgi:Mn-dependent DtxR family transcriptional regulator